jgi:hypothetical protein
MRVLFLGLALTLAACAPSFDRARWASGRGDACGVDNPRPSMITAAEHAGLRTGAPRETVRELLGEPDAETPASDIYWLGAEPTGVDCHHMVIAYDAARLVDTITFVHG